MKNEGQFNSSISESRKIRKPLIEKKRRARINDSLETLKQILLESQATLKKSSANGHRTAKLEKADILEMTVSYVQNLRKGMRLDSKLSNKNSEEEIRVTSNTERVKCVALVPARLENGDIAYILPSSPPSCTELAENVWRPW